MPKVGAQVLPDCLPQTADQGQVPDHLEVQALRDLFLATNGRSWLTKTGWLEGCKAKEFREWFGVEVRDADVVGIRLSHNQLTGELPASLRNLQALEVLHLPHNALTGAPPATLSQLPALRELNLSHNQLRGTLPRFHPGAPLSYVLLGDNQFSGPLPPSLFRATLQALDVEHNRLSGPIPMALAGCQSLTMLNLSHNALTGELPEISPSDLALLEVVNVSHNQLSGLVSPKWASFSLVGLRLDHNAFTSIPVLGSATPGAAVNVEANRIGFGPLEPNFTSAGQPLMPGFAYLGQVVAGDDQHETQPITEPIRLAIALSGIRNDYQWQKRVGADFVDVAGATAAAFTIAQPVLADAGAYRCAVTNPQVPDLTLYSPVTTITLTPVAPLPPHAPADDLDRNWTETTTYDGTSDQPATSRVTAEGRQFADGLGRSTQAQARNLTERHVLAAQTLYGSGGQAAVSTLAAPIDNQGFNYAENFVRAAGSATPYGPADFERGPGVAPLPLDATAPGTLGHYYSTANTREPYTPASARPFSIQEHYPGPLGGVRRAAGPDDVTGFGSGHEARNGQLPVLQELDHYAQWRPHFGLTPAYAGSYYLRATKTVSIGPDGRETVAFLDHDGRAVAACLTGPQYAPIALEGGIHADPTNPTGWPRHLDLHVPAAGPTTLTVQGTGQVRVTDLLTDVDVTTLGTAGPLPPGTPIPVHSLTLAPGLYRVLSLSDNQLIRYSVHYGDFSYTYADDAGPTVATVPPKGISRVPGAVPELVTRNEYVGAGLLGATTSPDAGRTEYVCRRDGELRFSQSATQRAARQFSYVNLDTLGRVLESGVYQMPPTPVTGTVLFENHWTTAPHTRSVLRGALLNSRTRDGGLGTGGAASSRRTQVNSVWYDRTFDWELHGMGLSGRRQRFVRGAVAKTAVAPTANGQPTHTSWYSYDDLGRLEWLVQHGPLGVKTLDYRYDISGNVLEVAYQKDQPDAFYHYYHYDADERLRAVYTSPDGVNRTQLARYAYYLHGPLKRAELANRLQAVDYVYTIGGQLKSLNHRHPAHDPGQDAAGNNAVVADLFGLTLDYFSGDYRSAADPLPTPPVPPTTAHPDRHDGTIRATGWHTTAYHPTVPNPTGRIPQHLTTYRYDERGQFTSSEAATFDDETQTVVPVPNLGYSERDLSYDPNGNLLSLHRRDGAGFSTDHFNYHYTPGTNQLAEVRHQSTGAAALRYAYDATGRITRTQDLGTGADRYLRYDAAGLVTGIYRDAAATQPLVEYDYDDRGFRAAQRVWGPPAPVTEEPGGGGDDPKSRSATTAATGSVLKQWELQRETYYVRDAAGTLLSLYERPAAALRATRTEVPLYGAGRVGIYRTPLPATPTANPDAPDTHYELNDHLGNARVVFRQPRVTVRTAGLEPGQAAEEEETFELLPQTRYATPDAYEGQHVAALPLHVPDAQGPKATLAVAAGDSARFGAWVLVPQDGPAELVSSPLVGVALSQTAADALTNPGPTATPPTETTPRTTSWLGQALRRVGLTLTLNGLLSRRTAARGALAKTPHGAVQAWLYYSVLDAEGNYVRGEQVPLPDDAYGSWAHLSVGTVAEQAGTVEFQIAGMNLQQPVYVDALALRHRTGLVVQEQHLTPYGAPLTGLSYVVGGRRYRHGYQGQYAENDTTTGWQSFELRLYEARTGRWLSTDPYGQFASPYLGMGNNPVSGVDPDGGWWSWGGAAIGAVSGAIAGGAVDAANGGEFFGRGMLIGMGVGAVAGGLLAGSRSGTRDADLIDRIDSKLGAGEICGGGDCARFRPFRQVASSTHKAAKGATSTALLSKTFINIDLEGTLIALANYSESINTRGTALGRVKGVYFAPLSSDPTGSFNLSRGNRDIYSGSYSKGESFGPYRRRGIYTFSFNSGFRDEDGTLGVSEEVTEDEGGVLTLGEVPVQSVVRRTIVRIRTKVDKGTRVALRKNGWK